MASLIDRGKDKRQHFRIRYPLDSRPRLKVLGRVYEVIDVCEKGIKFYCEDGHLFKQGKELSIRVIFDDGDTLDLEGSVLRIEATQVVICMEEGIPFGKIIHEQRYLNDKHSASLSKLSITS